MDSTLDTSTPDKTPVKTLSIWWIIALGISSTLFSVSMFYWQVAHHTDQATGKIVTIMDSSVMIVDKRGKVTALTITPETTIHAAKVTTTPDEPLPPKNDVNQLAIGQIVHTFGVIAPDGKFISTDIRVVDRHEPKIKN